MVAYVFPGQGSQKRGMGEHLFSLFPDLVSEAGDILGYSIVDLCEHDDARLSQTQYTQPALYIVNALSYYQRLNTDKMEPQYVAGHSLGEYNALLAAEVFDFATGLKLVQKRGELMSQARDGAMAAIIGLDDKQLHELFKGNNLSTLSVANYNTYKQLVIAGSKDEMEQAGQIFKKTEGIRFIPLNTSGAFHSPLMKDAQQQFEDFMAEFSFAAPKIPVIANVTAKPYHADQVASLLTQQITHPVKWVDTIEYLSTQGETDIEEVGPGNVLTNIIRRIRKKQ